MSFYWKGDMLYASSGESTNSEDDVWTSFLMDLREPSEVAADLEDFCRFLTTALAFTANLREITLYFNKHKIFHLEKKRTSPQVLSLPRGIDTYSPQRMFNLRSIDSAKVQIDAKMMHVVTNTAKTSLSKMFKAASATGPPLKDSDVGTYNIYLRTVTGHLNVSVSSQFVTQMERATKKPPPKKTTYALVFTSKDEYDASELKNPVFANLVPFPEQGRVYIGFQTHQTTGTSGHMAARFMPTVERESIDFVDPYMKQWNRELLGIGGILSRCVYEEEMSDIGKLYGEIVKPDTSSDKTAQDWLQNRALHTLQFFSFASSTPSPIVGADIESAFFKCAQNGLSSLSMMSTRGILPLHKVRLSDDAVKGFIKETPVIPASIMENAKLFIRKLTDRGAIVPITTDDILTELSNRALSEQEMTEAFKWWIAFCYRADRGTLAHFQSRFLNSAVMTVGTGVSERIVPLSQIRYWLNPQRIPPEVRLPSSCLPYPFSKAFPSADLANFFGQWQELSLETWIKFLVSEKAEDPTVDIELSPVFAENVLTILARAWSSLGKGQKEAIIATLSQRACIPTKTGMKTPTQAYLPNVNLFDDLPTVTFSSKKLPETLLEALGVRRHVELQLIFTRMISTSAWNHVDMVKYLTSIQTGLKAEGEIDRLKVTPIFPKEGEIALAGQPVKRYTASKLYEPLDSLRSLGLPIIDWPVKWRSNSEEAKFLSLLGLQRHPPLDVLLVISGSDNFKLRDQGFAYLIENFAQYQKDYHPGTVQVPFIPLRQNESGQHLGKPYECYGNEQASAMGFFVVTPEVRPTAEQKLGVRPDPPASELKRVLLSKPPKDHAAGVKVFQYLATRIAEFSTSDRRELGATAWIPAKVVKREASPNGVKTSTVLAHVSPNDCYFENKDALESETAWMRGLFTHVDFGEEANIFLQACGVKNSPTVAEITAILVQPRMAEEIYHRAGSVENYLKLLRQIAANMQSLSRKRDLISSMKKTPFLVASRRVINTAAVKKPVSPMNDDFDLDDDAEQDLVTWHLVTPSQAVIADDPSSLNAFRSVIRAAPQEDTLEVMYEQLGSKRLSTMVREKYTYGGTPTETTDTARVRKRILERVPLFLHGLEKSRRIRNMDWLNKYLQVRNVDAIKHQRELTIPGTLEVKSSVEQETATIDSGSGKCVLFISNFDVRDFYDVAVALCRTMVVSPRASDATILNHLLEKSLRQLKQQGHPVERLIQRAKDERAVLERDQRLAREAEEELRREEQRDMERQTKEAERVERDWKQLERMFPDVDPAYVRAKLQSPGGDNVEAVLTDLLENGYPKKPPPQPKGLLNKIKSSWWEKPAEPQVVPAQKQAVGQGQGQDQGQSQSQRAGGSSQNGMIGRGPSTDLNTTQFQSSESLLKSLKQAIHRSAPHTRATLETGARNENVPEVPESYCDHTVQQSLRNVGDVAGMRFYMGNDLLQDSSNVDNILSQHAQAATRFAAEILFPLVHAYDIDPRAMNLFIDKAGPCIAFNAGGSLFMNLRYYLKEQDLEVQQGRSGNTLVYWFSTIAHELAHNMVGPHNAQHEFFYSSFIEMYWSKLLPLLPRIEAL